MPLRVTRRNVEAGFYNATGFHPLRRSRDYDPDRPDEPDSGARTDGTGFKKRTRKVVPIRKAKRKTTKSPSKKRRNPSGKEPNEAALLAKASKPGNNIRQMGRYQQEAHDWGLYRVTAVINDWMRRVGATQTEMERYWPRRKATRRSNPSKVTYRYVDGQYISSRKRPGKGKIVSLPRGYVKGADGVYRYKRNGLRRPARGKESPRVRKALTKYVRSGGKRNPEDFETEHVRADGYLVRRYDSWYPMRKTPQGGLAFLNGPGDNHDGTKTKARAIVERYLREKKGKRNPGKAARALRRKTATKFRKAGMFRSKPGMGRAHYEYKTVSSIARGRTMKRPSERPYLSNPTKRRTWYAGIGEAHAYHVAKMHEYSAGGQPLNRAELAHALAENEVALHGQTSTKYKLPAITDAHPEAITRIRKDFKRYLAKYNKALKDYGGLSGQRSNPGKAKRAARRTASSQRRSMGVHSRRLPAGARRTSRSLSSIARGWESKAPGLRNGRKRNAYYPGGGASDLLQQAWTAGKRWRTSGAYHESGVANARVVTYGFSKWIPWDKVPRDIGTTRAKLLKAFREGYAVGRSLEKKRNPGNPGGKQYEVKIPSTYYHGGYSLTIRANSARTARAEAKDYCASQFAAKTGKPKTSYKLPKGTKVTPLN